MKVKCDECNHYFEFKPQRRDVKEGIVEVYIECPNCNEEYHSYYANERVKKLMQENAKLQKQARKNGKMTEIRENKDKIKEEQEKIKREVR
jgi:DNA-directed RNA polymerase subunit RPC12/RpoP